MRYDVIMIGASAGGMETLKEILSVLEPDFAIPIVVVQHIAADSDNYLVTYLNAHADIVVKEAAEKEHLHAGVVYICPPNYHLLLEEDKTITLATFEKVNFSRPSIDVLFETGAMAFYSSAIALLLTGASRDGTYGMGIVHSLGGMTVVQDPQTAYVPNMPASAIKSTPVDYVLPLQDIAPFFNTLSRNLRKP